MFKVFFSKTITEFQCSKFFVKFPMLNVFQNSNLIFFDDFSTDHFNGIFSYFYILQKEKRTSGMTITSTITVTVTVNYTAIYLFKSEVTMAMWIYVYSQLENMRRYASPYWILFSLNNLDSYLTARIHNKRGSSEPQHDTIITSFSGAQPIRLRIWNSVIFALNNEHFSLIIRLNLTDIFRYQEKLVISITRFNVCKRKNINH